MLQTQTEIVEKIKASYENKEKGKLEQLKELDKKTKRPAKIFAYVYGTASSLVLGTGMCYAMKVIGNSMALGIGVGLLGILLAATTYPLYKAILKSRKKKAAQQIFALSDELLHQ